MLGNRIIMRRALNNGDAAQPNSGLMQASDGPQSVVPPRASDLLTPEAAAERLSVNAKMLERWRGNGSGPRFVRLSRKTIRYMAADLEAFITDRVRTNTAPE
jgi:hypothetical protein